MNLKSLKRARLSGYAIKWCAVVTMILDHLYIFAHEIVSIPLWFRWIGRLSAPLFIYMLVEGMAYSRHRFKYILRLYVASLVMHMGNLIVTATLPNMHGIMLNYNIFASLFTTACLIWVVDLLRNAWHKKMIKNILFWSLIGASYVLIGVLFSLLPDSTIRWILWYLVPTPLTVEGGWFFVLLGVVMYLLRQDKLRMIGVYLAFSLIYGLLPANTLVEGFTTYFQWMMIAAIPFFWLYDGTRGKGFHRLFYLVYPVHIYLLYLLGVFL